MTSTSVAPDHLPSVDEITRLQIETVEQWHEGPITNTFVGFKRLVCQQHEFNYRLWHEEDIARSRDVSDAKIAEVKRAIDRLNQARNDHIEKLDDWLTEALADRSVQPQASAIQNTETPGSAIDRLSIMALRLYHYREQLDRTDVEQAHVERVQQRIVLCEEQRLDLSNSLKNLLDGIEHGRFIHKTYRQMKMYNDPTLNPQLYAPKHRAAG